MEDYVKFEGSPINPTKEFISSALIWSGEVVTLLAVICGCETWNDIEDYGRLKLEFLRSLLPFKNGAPSDDTLRRFFRAIDTDKFQELFRSWINSILTLMGQNNSDNIIPHFAP